jgi:hypothetical protein
MQYMPGCQAAKWARARPMYMNVKRRGRNAIVDSELEEKTVNEEKRVRVFPMEKQEL